MSMGIVQNYKIYKYYKHICFIYRMVQLPIPSASGVLLSVMQKFPSTAGVVLISMAFTSCGGLALIVGVLVYFVLVIVFALAHLSSVI